MRQFPATLGRLGIGSVLLTACLAAPKADVNFWQLQETTVQVPSSMRWWPFDSTRTLRVPPGTSVSVLARINGARFLLALPNGDILVSIPGSGRIQLVRPRPNLDPLVFTFAQNLRFPHDMVLDRINNQDVIYISESNRIVRCNYATGNTASGPLTTVISNLPDESLPELGGAYGHVLKNIAVDANHRIYVSIASASNAWVGDATSNPVRCAVYRYESTGGSGTLIARGIRNAEGLAFLPGTSDLWVTNNARDNTPYPFQDESGWYGEVHQDYVDNNPPDGFTRVLAGRDYGWPYANPIPNSRNRLTYPPLAPDYDNNPSWATRPAGDFTPYSKGILAHSAPLGVSFFQGSAVPSAWRAGAAIAYHGSWNRSDPSGYLVGYFPWHSETGMPQSEAAFVTGFRNSSGDVWGRPVDVVPHASGDVLISDDHSGTIYRLTGPNSADTGTVTGGLSVADGAVDWRRARNFDWAEFVINARRTDVTPMISQPDLLGESNLSEFATGRTVTFPGGTATTSGLAATGTNQGITFRVAADTTMRTLHIAVGSRTAPARLTARLSDSPREFTFGAKGLPTNFRGVATLHYRASGPGQSLTVNWTAGNQGTAWISGAVLGPTRTQFGPPAKGR
ncbi:MAG: hypothetical protein SFX74_11775 [Fimbriimonadaceae bacterium]|nr:hypothetical protein [Fimbriimonadaceae bacterium]